MTHKGSWGWTKPKPGAEGLFDPMPPSQHCDWHKRYEESCVLCRIEAGEYHATTSYNSPTPTSSTTKRIVTIVVIIIGTALIIALLTGV